MIIPDLRRGATVAVLTLALACSANLTAAVAKSSGAYGAVVYSRPHDISAEIHGKAEFIVHTMPSVKGEIIKASTLLIVPDGEAPKDGWPVIAWAHGTTTPGDKRCAPTVTKDLDGGMTRDGFKSDYLFQLATFVNAGYAVVAPDFEGLGDIANVPLPYFNASSLSRSLVSGLIAAHEINPNLSNRYVSAGHSDGAHAVLGIEPFVKEAPQFDYLGSVAIAPYAAIEATIDELARKAKADSKNAEAFTTMANFHVGLMATGLSVVDDTFDPSTIMGKDLATLLKDFTTQCSMGVNIQLSSAIKAKGDAFQGYNTDWAKTPKMAEFLRENDVAVDPTFRIAKPTLISVGTDDPFIFNNQTRKLVARLEAANAPVTFKEYPGDDHFTIIRTGEKDVMSFIDRLFDR